MQRGKGQMARFGDTQSHFYRFQIAHFADQNHIRILAKSGSQCGSERVRVGGDLTLIFDGLECMPDGYSTLGSLTVEGLSLEVQASGLRTGPLPAQPRP